MIRSLILAAALIATPAFAQDSINAHGLNAVPNDGGLHDPIRTWQVEEHDRGSLGVNVLGEYAYEPVVRHKRVGNVVTETPEITDLTALNLGVFYSPYNNVALTVAAPAYLSVEGEGARTGLELGDVRASAYLGVSDEKGGVALVPHLDIPGTYPGQFLRSDGIAGGGVIAATYAPSRLRVSGNVGIQFTPEVEILNVSGGERLLSSIAASYQVGDDVALRAEGTFNPSLSKNDFAGTDSPAEATLSVAGHSGQRLTWVAGGSLPVSQGVGAASARAFLGATWAIGKRPSDCPACYEINITVTPPPDCDLVKVEGGRILLLEPVLFDYDKATIRIPESSDILDAVVRTLNDYPEIALVEVAGHTDERGSVSYNKDLSQRRMEAVVDYLVERGVSRDRLSPVGYGEGRLLRDDCGTDEDCHQTNRRVELIVLEAE